MAECQYMFKSKILYIYFYIYILYYLFIFIRQWHPTQYSCLENPMDGGAWKAAVHGVAEGRT